MQFEYFTDNYHPARAGSRATNVDTVNYAKTTQSWQTEKHNPDNDFVARRLDKSRLARAVENDRLTERWAFLFRASSSSMSFFFHIPLFVHRFDSSLLAQRSVVIYEWRHRHTNDELINPIGLTSQLIRRKKRTAELAKVSGIADTANLHSSRLASNWATFFAFFFPLLHVTDLSLWPTSLGLIRSAPLRDL